MCERKVGETTALLDLLWSLHLAWPPCPRALWRSSGLCTENSQRKGTVFCLVSCGLEQQQQGQQGTREGWAGWSVVSGHFEREGKIRTVPFPPLHCSQPNTCKHTPTSHRAHSTQNGIWKIKLKQKHRSQLAHTYTFRFSTSDWVYKKKKGQEKKVNLIELWAVEYRLTELKPWRTKGTCSFLSCCLYCPIPNANMEGNRRTHPIRLSSQQCSH